MKSRVFPIFQKFTYGFVLSVSISNENTYRFEEFLFENHVQKYGFPEYQNRYFDVWTLYILIFKSFYRIDSIIML